MKCSVFIAASVDGFIAREDGNLDWLHTSGKQGIDMGEQEDMGFNAFMASVDCMIMGRKCMDTVNSMNLTEEQWPYGNTRIIVLSNTIKEVPHGLKGRVEMYSGDILDLIKTLEQEGYQHAYVDGGNTIQAFINLELINEIIITRTPILLGGGIPLFGGTLKDIKLENCQAIAFNNDFIQESFTVNYHD